MNRRDAMNIDKDEINVSDDHLLLTDLLDEYAIPVKQLAREAGRAASTLYKFCSGERTIPSVIWRTLYRLTRDGRIPTLLTGDVPVVVAPILADALKIDRPTIRTLWDQRKKTLTVEQNVLNIINDGVIDGTDRRQLEKYNKNFPELIQSLYQVHEAINREFQKSKK